MLQWTILKHIWWICSYCEACIYIGRLTAFICFTFVKIELNMLDLMFWQWWLWKERLGFFWTARCYNSEHCTLHRRVYLPTNLSVVLVYLQWDLVCSRTPLKSTVQMTVSLGKFLGALVFGFVADKYGIRTL
jgi:hypothetical protein